MRWIECRLCRKRTNRLVTHLRRAHAMTLEEYTAEHDGAPVLDIDEAATFEEQSERLLSWFGCLQSTTREVVIQDIRELALMVEASLGRPT